MPDPKISLVTVTYNAEATIKRCIESVLSQTYNNIEYIIIDGGSSDKTLRVIDTYKQHIKFLVSEPDNGIYDAMNKGIQLATGEIIGTLNADDVFADTDVLSSLAATFKQQSTSIIYGNLNYINVQGKTVRRWVSAGYKNGIFNWGWMPPHPTFYCKKELFERFGLYDLQYGTAGDYELMLRFMHLNKIEAFHLNKVIVKMSIGGVSNKSYLNRIKAWRFDLKAMKKNGVSFPVVAIVFKPLRKVLQYI